MVRVVVTGPPASGKTDTVLDHLRSTLVRGRPTLRVVVPTITMAEHLRNQLAREGLVPPPSAVLTFSKFISDLAPDLIEPPAGAFEALVEQALAAEPRSRFAGVREFAGFRRSCAGALSELAAAGVDPAMLDSDLRTLFVRVRDAAAEHGWLLRAERLRLAAERLQPAISLAFDGFYAFTGPELRVITALNDVIVTLPEWDGAASALRTLIDAGFEQRRVDRARPQPATSVVIASTIEEEAEEIARRIVAHGPPFRNIGIVLRSEQPYAPAIRCALERFGIPFRFYFSQPLSREPVVRFITALMDTMLAGWDLEQAGRMLRMPGSPLADDHAFELKMRTLVPGAGLEKLQEHVNFAELDAWRADKLSAAEWSVRFKTLPAFVAAEPISDRIPHAEVERIRTRFAALEAFAGCVDEAVNLFDAADSVTCAEFWRTVQLCIGAASLRVPDHRRDVVHVIDAPEARQWSLPIVFVPGMVEREFPKYHAEDPVLGDALRGRLQAAGHQLRTSVQRQGDEAFLFSVVRTRASAELVVSYPELNAKGDANLPSFFLETIDGSTERALGARPVPSRTAATSDVRQAIADPALQGWIRAKHTRVSASQVDRYLRCPFLFFAESTLGLKPLPAGPWDRFDARAQGNLVHRTLEFVYRDRMTLDDAFHRAFERVRTEAVIPDGYRTEAILLEIRKNLEVFVQAGLQPGSQSLYENRFEMPLDDEVVVKGRIDRIDVLPDGRALVIDYKYSAQAEKYSDDHENGHAVQGGLYLASLRQFGDFQPAGMIYAGLRGKVTYGGWVAGSLRMDGLPAATSEVVREQMVNAIETARTAVSAARTGSIAVRPSDPGNCRTCDLNDVCRRETLPAEIVEGAGA